VGIGADSIVKLSEVGSPWGREASRMRVFCAVSVIDVDGTGGSQRA
jgi:hypothetical protein